MALSATSMRDRIVAKIAAVPYTQNSDPANAQAYHDAIWLAICQGIVEEITTNARAVGTDTGTYGGDSHNLNIV
jgi:hypothetical protein